LKKAAKRIYENEYKKQKAVALRAARTRGRKQIREKARKIAFAEYDITSGERKKARKQKLKKTFAGIASGLEKMGKELETGMGVSTQRKTPKKPRTTKKVARKTVRKKPSKPKYVVVGGKAYKLATPTSKRKKSTKRKTVKKKPTKKKKTKSKSILDMDISDF
jgi:hypothetical protein